MRSPFPGFDPYVEDPTIWLDFRSSFITYCADMLLECLPPDYDARMAEHRWTVEETIDDGPVVRGRQITRCTTEMRDLWIKVLHGPGRSLVTVVELLCPSHKSRAGCREYLAKRRGVLEQQINLVEIDLLKAGDRVPILRPPPHADHYVFVARGDRTPCADVYAWSVRDPLPTIPIPLRPPDADVMLDLAALFSRAYERGRYERALRYDQPLRAPLAAEDVRWAEELAAPMRRPAPQPPV